jgi:tRNA dimethylallyltransferase
MEKEVKNIVLVLLGPTASGKTALSVALAKVIQAEIISADSRQVYKGMDIGTGKDLELYADVPYHLIDICEAGERYNLPRFQTDVEMAIEKINKKGKKVILCGGSGLYLQAIIQGFGIPQMSVDEEFRLKLEKLSNEDLLNTYESFKIKPESVDLSTRKRLIRAIEKSCFLKKNTSEKKVGKAKNTEFVVFGLNPSVEIRRKNISIRLKERLANGLIEEVQRLLDEGLSHEVLQYYGLEYKYLSYYILGQMSKIEMQEKLETEIHRFAKRQMTFFRSMETKGVKIYWLPEELSLEAKVKYIISKI